MAFSLSLKFRKKMKNNCSFKKKNYKERASKFRSEVTDGLLSLSTRRDLNSTIDRTQKIRLSGPKGTFEIPSPAATKRNEQDLGHLNAKSIQQGQGRSHSSLRWLLQGPAPPLEESPRSRPGTAPGCSRLPSVAPAPQLLGQAALLDNDLTGLLPWPGDS